MKKLARILIVVALLALGSTIVVYYWITSTLTEMKYVPMYLMILTISYILIQVLKRYLFTKQAWWDWLYYIALISMMLGIFFGAESNTGIMNWITDIGTLFFVIPPILDLKFIFKTERK